MSSHRTRRVVSHAAPPPILRSRSALVLVAFTTVLALGACARDEDSHDEEGRVPPTGTGELRASRMPGARVPMAEAGAPPAAWSDAIGARVEASAYAIAVDDAGALVAENAAHGLRAAWDDAGLTVHVRERDDDPEFGRLRLATTGLGRGDRVEAVEAAEPIEGACRSDGALDVAGACLRRVEREAGGVVEWYENRPDGVEQGWTLATRPAGAGKARVELAIEGAAVVLDADGKAATLTPSGARTLRYGGLRAWDATGKELASSFVFHAPGLAIEVDDAGATYPITIDPLLTSVAWSAEPNQAGAQFGWSVGNAGDVNGDGYSDAIVGANKFVPASC
jgi:hypothetical protein